MCMASKPDREILDDSRILTFQFLKASSYVLFRWWCSLTTSSRPSLPCGWYQWPTVFLCP